jgi:hypothetical protein
MVYNCRQKSLENENKNNNLKEFDTKCVINGKYFIYNFIS